MRKTLILCGLLLAAATVPVTPAQAQEKDPTTAALLGGLLGFGSGHYYARDMNTGYIFSAVDVGLIVGLVAVDDAEWIFGLGLLGSHAYQAFDAADKAKRYNRRMGLGLFGTPVGLSIDSGAFGSGMGSTQIETLFAEGGASRDLALGLSMARELQPPLKLHATVDDPGMGMSYNVSF